MTANTALQHSVAPVHTLILQLCQIFFDNGSCVGAAKFPKSAQRKTMLSLRPNADMGEYRCILCLTWVLRGYCGGKTQLQLKGILSHSVQGCFVTVCYTLPACTFDVLQLQPCFWNQLPFSLRQPHFGTSSISYSPVPSPITSSSSDSPLCSSITQCLVHPRLKTYLFHKPYPPLPVVSLFPGLPSRSTSWTASFELLGF